MSLLPLVVVLIALVHVHLVILVSRTAIEHAMVLPMAVVIVHVVGRRMRARRSVRRGRVGVGLEQRAAIPDRRAVAVVDVPGMAGVLVRIVEMAAGVEPVETIGHHQAEVSAC